MECLALVVFVVGAYFVFKNTRSSDDGLEGLFTEEPVLKDWREFAASGCPEVLQLAKQFDDLDSFRQHLQRMSPYCCFQIRHSPPQIFVDPDRYQVAKAVTYKGPVETDKVRGSIVNLCKKLVNEPDSFRVEFNEDDMIMSYEPNGKNVYSWSAFEVDPNDTISSQVVGHYVDIWCANKSRRERDSRVQRFESLFANGENE